MSNTCFWKQVLFSGHVAQTTCETRAMMRSFKTLAEP